LALAATFFLAISALIMTLLTKAGSVTSAIIKAIDKTLLTKGQQEKLAKMKCP
jgi:hypothetical protein